MNTSKLAATLLVPFSGFFLVSIVPISPVYFFGLIGVIFFASNLITNSFIKRDSILNYLTFYFGYIIFSQILLDPDHSAFSNILLNFFYFFPCLILIRRLNIVDIISISKLFIRFSICLLLIESIYRLSHPVFQIEASTKDYRDMEGMLFYAYKNSSIMFSDSNFVGVYALVVFFFNLYLLKIKLIKSRFTLLILFALIVATLSRSAIITTIVSLILLNLLGKKKVTLPQIILLVGSAFGIGYFILQSFSGDFSFLSKFRILELGYKFILEGRVEEILFGIGFGNSSAFVGMGAHNLFITYLIESGILGLLQFLFIQFYLIKKSGRNTLYLTLPLFIAGFSLVGHAIPFYFSCLAIVYILSQRKQEIFYETDFSSDSYI